MWGMKDEYNKHRAFRISQYCWRERDDELHDYMTVGEFSEWRTFGYIIQPEENIGKLLRESLIHLEIWWVHINGFHKQIIRWSTSPILEMKKEKHLLVLEFSLI